MGEEPNTRDADREAGEKRLRQRLSRIRRRIVVMSGKGGVGKSTVAVNLAVGLARLDQRVGLLDADLHGPSVPTMLGIEGESAVGDEDGIRPVRKHGVAVVSGAFFLPSSDEAVIWRGPLKAGVLKQFLTDVAWGELDFLVVDLPPGTGDEPLSVCQLLDRVDGVLVVTTPQKVAAVDVRKAITFCRRLKLPVLGVLENMAGFACPQCGRVTAVFREGGGRKIATGMGVPFLGSIPIDPDVADACDAGRPFVNSHPAAVGAALLRQVTTDIVARLETAAPAESMASTP